MVTTCKHSHLSQVGRVSKSDSLNDKNWRTGVINKNKNRGNVCTFVYMCVNIVTTCKNSHLLNIGGVSNIIVQGLLMQVKKIIF